MFIDTETKEENSTTRERVLPDSPIKLSVAMRIGCLMRPPSQPGNYDFFDKCGSCALGAAYHAITGKVVNERYVMNELAKLTSVPRMMLEQASDRFESRCSTREEIANWLESKGY